MILRIAFRVTSVAVLIAAGMGTGRADDGKMSAVPLDATSDQHPITLTADEAVRIGLEHNPQIAAGAAGLSAATATYRSLAAFPSVQLGVTRVQGTSTAPTLNGETSDTFVDVGETLDVSGQRRYQAASAKSQAASARFQLDDTKLALEQQIRDAYWSLVAAHAQVAISEDTLRDVERVRALTETQEKAGAAPRADVVRSGIDAANAEQAAITARAAEQSALAALNLLLARPPLAPVVPADTIGLDTEAHSVVPSIPNLPELQRLAAANRTLLRSADEQVRAAHYSLEQARASRFPDVSIDYERSVQQASGADSVLLGARFPLLDMGEVTNTIRAAGAGEKQARAQRDQTRQQVAQQVAQSYVDFQQAEQLLASYRDDILKPSVKLLAMAQLGYKQGATGILPVIDAENTLRSARTGYIGALLGLYKAHDEVIAATGGLIERPAAAKEHKQ